MLQKCMTATLLTVALISASSAFAQPDGRGRQDARGRNDMHDNRPGFHESRRNGHRDDDRRLGIGPNFAFHRGDRLPPHYRNRHYVVENWRIHHLRQPPRGHQWVQIGANYALVAITTGMIVDLAVNR